MDIREELIRKGLNKWVHNKFNGILNFVTGTGKSYAAILAAEYLIKTYKNEKVLIVCPTDTTIENLKKEFIKFKKKKLLLNCQFICYASISKIKENYSLVVLDEIHHVTSDKRMEFFKNVKYRSILGLTASLTKTQISRLSPYIKIVDKINMQQARDLDLVAKHTIINYALDFTSEERKKYDKYTSKIDSVFEEYNTTAWREVGLRSHLIYNAENKLKELSKIVDLFKGEYGILFSLTKDQSDLVSNLLGDTCVSIHSGKTKSEKLLLQKLFSDGRTKIRTISTAKIFDEGVTLPRLSYGILISRYSKERQSIQTIGRCIRNDILNKHSIILRLYIKNSKEEEWVEKSQINYKPIQVNNYEQLKREIQKIRSST